jgi:hypothetical protein
MNAGVAQRLNVHNRSANGGTDKAFAQAVRLKAIPIAVRANPKVDSGKCAVLHRHAFELFERLWSLSSYQPAVLSGKNLVFKGLGQMVWTKVYEGC